MKCCRFQRKRIFISLFCLLVIFIIEYFYSNNTNSLTNCKVAAPVQKKMNTMLKGIVSSLTDLNLSYFLCYDSLWGALKLKGPLPWEKKIDLCILNKEVSNVDELFLVRTFKRYGLEITYNIVNGVYTVLLPGIQEPFAKLTVFEEDSVTRQMRKVGWAHRVLPPNACDQLHCFPPELITKPLKTLHFLSYMLPVPHEEIEIQKYLFPNSWWKELQPTNCA